MSDLIVIEELQAYLVSEGVGQLPAADPSLTLPGIYTQPRGGAFLPRRDNGEWLENATITLNDQLLNGPPGAEAWIEDTFVDIIVRARNAGEAKLIHRTIASLLHPIGKLSGHADWTMHELHVLQTMIWRREQALPTVGDGDTYDRVASYRISVTRSTLA